MKTLRYTTLPTSEVPVVEVPLSKSVANRWLILEALFPNRIVKGRLSEARDTRILRDALHSEVVDINVEDAGTAMRFATAYFSVVSHREAYLHGTDRMHERPIDPLVVALRKLGAEIRYEDEHGYPPLRIYGRQLRGGEVYIPADMSSQFISALMLVAPAMQDGLLINRTSKAVSQPYVDMTAAVLKQAGVNVEYDGPRIHVHGAPEETVQMPTEGDWSAAAALVAWVAVSGKPLVVKGLSKVSVQGDKVLIKLVNEVGVVGEWKEGLWHLHRSEVPEEDLQLDLLDHPDLAQPLIMAAFLQGRSGKVSGLQTLRIKETDRIAALVRTMRRLGAEVTSTHGVIYWHPPEKLEWDDIPFELFSDHRMAMAMAPLAFFGEMNIETPEVVDKSFPSYWEEMKKVGLDLS